MIYPYQVSTYPLQVSKMEDAIVPASKSASEAQFGQQRIDGRIEITSIAGAIFTLTQQRVCALLFGQPNRQFFVTEISECLATLRRTPLVQNRGRCGGSFFLPSGDDQLAMDGDPRSRQASCGLRPREHRRLRNFISEVPR